MKKVILALGSNTHRTRNMALAKTSLRNLFPVITFTRAIITENIDASSADFLNCLAETETDLSVDTLKHLLKNIEHQLGDSHQQHANGTVIMDIDLLLYDHTRYKEADWERPYIKQLMTELEQITSYNNDHN